MSQTVFGTANVVTILNRGFNNASPANAIFNNQVNQAGTTEASQVAFANSFGASFAGLTDAQLSTQVLGNLGVLPNPDLVQALTDYFGSVDASSRGLVVLQLGLILEGLETAPAPQDVFNAAAKAWNNEVSQSFIYSSNPANTTAFNGDFAPVPPATQGQTFTLTAAIDNVVGTGGNDTFIGDSTSGNPADQIDGGAGIDTVRLTNFGQGNLTALPQVKNVENISLVGFNSAAAVDVAAVTGLNTLTIENNPVQNVSITGLSGTQSLGVTNVSDNTKTISGTYGATDATASLVVTGSKDAGAVNFTGAKIATVNVNSTGAVANKLANLTVTTGKLTNLVITGDQALTVTTDLTVDTVKIDGSASTGGFKLGHVALTANLTATGGSGADTLTILDGGGKAATVSLGAGNDKLSLGDLATYAATSTFAGGDGTDTIVINDGAGLTATTGKQITGFETLDLAGGQNTYDVSFLAGGNTISTIQVGADLAAATVVKNVATGSAVNLLASTTSGLDVQVKDAATGKADSLTFNIGGAAAVTASSLTAANVETITLNSTTKLATFNNATDTNTVTSLVTDKATVLNIIGDKTLTLAAMTDTVLAKIDASAFTGNFVMSSATAAGSILGGTGNDTLLAAATGSTINAGKGNDTITLNAAAAKDVVIYAAGDATAVVTAGALDTAKIESIANFKTGVDVIDLGSFGFTGQQKSALAVKGDLTAASLGADVANFFVDTGVARGVAVATVGGGDQYLFVDVNKDGNFNVATDLVVHLVGANTANYADIGF